jgi:hypothetical protein
VCRGREGGGRRTQPGEKMIALSPAVGILQCRENGADRSKIPIRCKAGSGKVRVRHGDDQVILKYRTGWPKVPKPPFSPLGTVNCRGLAHTLCMAVGARQGRPSGVQLLRLGHTYSTGQLTLTGQDRTLTGPTNYRASPPLRCTMYGRSARVSRASLSQSASPNSIPIIDPVMPFNTHYIIIIVILLSLGI